MTDKIEQLKKAKDAVRWLLDNDGLVDMHGLEYWAGVVARLRREIKDNL